MGGLPVGSVIGNVIGDGPSKTSRSLMNRDHSNKRVEKVFMQMGKLPLHLPWAVEDQALLKSMGEAVLDYLFSIFAHSSPYRIW